MMTDELRYTIEDYLNETLSAEDKKTFETLLETNTEIQEEFIAIKATNQFLKEVTIDAEISENDYTNELREFYNSKDAQNTLRQIKDEHASRKINTPKSKSTRYLPLAAILVVALLSTVFLLNINKTVPAEELFVTYYDKEDFPSVVQRSDGNNTFQQAVTAFNDSKFDEAEILINNYISNVENPKASVLLYKGFIMLAQDKSDAALQSFTTVANSKSLDKSKGLWYMALTHLKQGKAQNAEVVLRQILEDETNFNYIEASEILDKLKK